MRIVPVIKPVSTQCNLRCVYCYHWGQETHQAEVRAKMNVELACSIVEQVLNLNRGPANFLWHGGEPLIAGLPFYQKISQHQKTLTNGRPVRNSIQTNATLVNEAWADFFAREKWNVGVSLDGPERIHNTNRLTPTGKGSFDLVMRGIETLSKAGAKPGLLAVVTKASLGNEEEIFNFFLETGLNFNLSPCMLGPNPTPEAREIGITAAEFAQFMCKAFDLWWKLDNPNTRIPTFSYAIQAILGKTPRVCMLAGSCANYVGIDFDGKVYPCGRFVGQDDVLLGDLSQSTLEELLSAEPYKRYCRGIKVVSPECASCRWFHACHGGCPYDRYIGNGEFAPKTSFCNAQKLIYEHVEPKTSTTKAVIDQNSVVPQ